MSILITGKVAIIVCAPVKNKRNCDYARRMGVNEILIARWPQPLPGSTVGQCEHCEGAMWVAPELLEQREKFLSSRVTHLFLCAICMGLEVRRLRRVALVGIPPRKPGQ